MEPTTLDSTAVRWSGSASSVGDLVDVARRAAELIGSGSEVACLSVIPPTGPDALPIVRLVLDDPDLSERIRMRLTEQEMLPHFINLPFAGSWRAEVDDLVLSVINLDPDVL